MWQSTGIVEYGTDKITLRIDRGIADYYRSLLPKYLYVKPQKYPPHITIIRSKKETPSFENWGQFEGQSVEFTYGPPIYFSSPYYFIQTQSEKIGQIRVFHGLSLYRFADTKSYHVTIGNVK